MIIYLRPHHLMCMQNFVGKGYSQDFTDNMTNIINYLKAHADDKIIKITFDEDNLCSKCPNRGLGKCLVATQHDKGYFNALHIDINKKYSWNDVKQLINQHINYKVFTNICSNCRWFYICNEIQQNSKTNLG